MKTVRVLNSTRNSVLCERCQIADSFWARGKGLLGRASLPADEGIWLSPGGSIHMFWMKFPIDVVFVTRDDVVADFVENIAPGKTYVAKDKGAGKPFAALEIAAGQIAARGLAIGDQLKRE